MAHDDVLAPDFLATSLTTLQAQPDAVLCYSAADIIDRHGGLMFTDDSRLPGTERPRPSDRFAEAVINQHMCFPIFALIRAEALRTLLLANYDGSDRALVASWRCAAASPTSRGPCSRTGTIPSAISGRCDRSGRARSTGGPGEPRAARCFICGPSTATTSAWCGASCPTRSSASAAIDRWSAGSRSTGTRSACWSTSSPCSTPASSIWPRSVKQGLLGRPDAPDSDGAAVESPPEGVRKHDARA